MRLNLSKLALVLALGLLPAGVHVSASAATFEQAGRPIQLAQAAAPEASKLFHGVGVVTAIDAKSGLITLKHDDIPGLMDAMEMEYQTKPKLAEGLHVGDKVDFTVDGRNLTIVDVKKLPTAK